MTQHTNEPWHAAEIARDSDTFVKICHANGGTIAKLWIDVDDSDFSDGQRADARRIVACVNACHGLPTDELEQNGLVAAVGTKLLDAYQQRDDLLEELVITLGSLKEICNLRQISRPESAIRRAEAAIEKAKGGAA